MTTKKFVNRYNFVPIPTTVQRRPLEDTPGLAAFRMDLCTGWLDIEITALTRLLFPIQREESWGKTPVWVTKKIRGERQKVLVDHITFFKFLEDPVSCRKMIPGTSLKGPIRAVMEVLSDSCLTLWGDHLDPQAAARPNKCRLQTEDGKPVMAPDEGLCVCCRLFGKTGEGGTAPEDQKGSNALQGRVVFSDALLLLEDNRLEKDQGKISSDFITMKELSLPKPRHTAFYLDKGKIRGRKFYLHQEEHQANYEELPEDELPPEKQGERFTDRNRSFRESVLPGARFTARVTFTNLTTEELGLLLWGLELDDLEATMANGDLSAVPDGLRAHKIGMGKPLGLGSVKVRVTAMALVDPASRYTHTNWAWPEPGKAGLAEVWEGEELRPVVTARKQDWSANAFSGKNQLTRLLTFTHFKGKKVEYPRYSWFKHQNYKNLPLPENGELEDPCPPPEKAGIPSNVSKKGTVALQPTAKAKPQIVIEKVTVLKVTQKGALIQVEGQDLMVSLGPYHGVTPGKRIKVQIIREGTKVSKPVFKGLVID